MLQELYGVVMWDEDMGGVGVCDDGGSAGCARRNWRRLSGECGPGLAVGAGVTFLSATDRSSSLRQKDHTQISLSGANVYILFRGIQARFLRKMCESCKSKSIGTMGFLFTQAEFNVRTA